MRILIVLTSAGNLGTDGSRTGFHFDEFAAVRLVLLAAGAELVLATPEGGAAPIDPASYDAANPSEAIRRFLAQPSAQDALRDTLELHRIDAGDFDAAFYPGGMGLLADLPNHQASIDLLNALHAAGRPMAFLSQGPAALCRVCDDRGRAIVAGRNITLMSASEARHHKSAAPGSEVPEQELRAAGASIIRAADRTPHVISDGHLITGQNPESAILTAQALLAAIAPRTP